MSFTQRTPLIVAATAAVFATANAAATALANEPTAPHTTAASASIAASAPSTQAPRVCVTLNVAGVRPNEGRLMVAAYASEEAFLRQPAGVASAAAGATPEQAVRVCAQSAGEVAFVLYQDLDSDGQMARNALGMPTEPWGASGQPSPMGPKWGSAKVVVSEGAAVAAQMAP